MATVLPVLRASHLSASACSSSALRKGQLLTEGKEQGTRGELGSNFLSSDSAAEKENTSRPMPGDKVSLPPETS